MDARSFFAVLAVLFLLWVIRIWAKWDSSAKMARESRQKLRNRMVESTLATRVHGASSESADDSDFDLDDDNDEESVQMRALRAELVDKVMTISDLQQTVDRLQMQVEGLQETASDITSSAATTTGSDAQSLVDNRTQLAQVQEKLADAQDKAEQNQQNDIELRRLRSELESVQLERSDAAKRIELLEGQLSEQTGSVQQDLQLDSSGDTDFGSANDIQQLQNELAERQLQNERLQEQLAAMSDSSSSVPESPTQPVAPQTPQRSPTPIFDAPADKDNLKLIKGIGPVMEKTLNELGVTTFRQLAKFTQSDIDKVSEAIGAFPGRVERDDWVGKAQRLMSETSSS